MRDAEAMARALALAWQGWGRVGRNPMVGAVVLRGGTVVAEACHEAFGGPHAERTALARAGWRSRGADLVVTLEPCRHHGKTPPCADAIVAAGIRRVVYGAADVDPEAKGGAAVMRAAGVTVTGGVLEDAVRAQNAAFFHRHADPARPWVALKLAMSLDGRIADADGRSRWITGPAARDWVHWLRAGFEAVAVGKRTARDDDPDLTVRGGFRPPVPPLRVVFDRTASLPAGARLVRTARDVPTVVLAEAPGPNADVLTAAGVEVRVAAGLGGALASLAERGVASVLVEGGGILAGRLLAEGLVDRIYLLAAPLLLGAGGRPAFADMPDATLSSVRRWRVVGRHALDCDTLLVLDRP
jgi:diaminohydroxyphosphoribosylaminopyrimidine deaminase/5-amino-6-(5-phosphoribosylamino)uracil reductase